MPINRPSSSWREWKPYTTEYSPDWGRSFDEYKKIFFFKNEDLKGKVVLDLGSGEDERFAGGVKNSGLDTKVISINPDYSLYLYGEDLKPKTQNNISSIAALGQELPFADNTFDRIFAFESVSRYSPPNKNFRAAVKWSTESYRVIKPNGKAEFVDLSKYGEDKKVTAAWNKLIEYLKRKGIMVSINEYTPEGFPPQAVFHKLTIEKHEAE